MQNSSAHRRSNGRGKLAAGDRVQLTDEKGKMYSFTLIEGGQWHSAIKEGARLMFPYAWYFLCKILFSGKITRQKTPREWRGVLTCNF